MGSSLQVQRCASVLCISGDGPGELMCCVAERNKNPNTSLPLRMPVLVQKAGRKASVKQ